MKRLEVRVLYLICKLYSVELNIVCTDSSVVHLIALVEF